MSTLGRAYQIASGIRATFLNEKMNIRELVTIQIIDNNVDNQNVQVYYLESLPELESERQMLRRKIHG